VSADVLCCYLRILYKIIIIIIASHEDEMNDKYNDIYSQVMK